MRGLIIHCMSIITLSSLIAIAMRPQPKPLENKTATTTALIEATTKSKNPIPSATSNRQAATPKHRPSAQVEAIETPNEWLNYDLETLEAMIEHEDVISMLNSDKLSPEQRQSYGRLIEARSQRLAERIQNDIMQLEQQLSELSE